VRQARVRMERTASTTMIATSVVVTIITQDTSVNDVSISRSVFRLLIGLDCSKPSWQIYLVNEPGQK